MAIIAARNEESTVGAVVRAAVSCTRIDDVLVVDNGSRDNTRDVSTLHGARVTTCAHVGKGEAIDCGLQASPVPTDSYLLLDADLLGLEASHLEAMIRALDESGVNMMCGILQDTWWRRLIYGSLGWLRIATLSGQRVIKASSLKDINRRELSGYRVEAFLNCLVGRRQTGRIVLSEVVHVRRDQKPIYAPRFRRFLTWASVPMIYVGIYARSMLLQATEKLKRII